MKKLLTGFLLSLCFVFPMSIASEDAIRLVNLDFPDEEIWNTSKKLQEGQTIAFSTRKRPRKLSMYAAFFCDHDKEISTVALAVNVKSFESSGSCVFKRNHGDMKEEEFYRIFF